MSVKTPEFGSYSSELEYECSKLSFPPATRTLPVFRTVVVFPFLAVLRLPVRVNRATPSVAVAVNEPKFAWIVVSPTDAPVAIPELLIAATPGAEEFQPALELTFKTVASEYVAVS